MIVEFETVIPDRREPRQPCIVVLGATLEVRGRVLPKLVVMTVDAEGRGPRGRLLHFLVNKGL